MLICDVMDVEDLIYFHEVSGLWVLSSRDFVFGGSGGRAATAAAAAAPLGWGRVALSLSTFELCFPRPYVCRFQSRFLLLCGY